MNGPPWMKVAFKKNMETQPTWQMDTGPSLRDQFAMAAPYQEILSILGGGEHKSLQKVTAARYQYADAMLEARKK